MEFRRSYSTLILMIFILWLNMRSMEIGSPPQDDVALIYGLDSLDRHVEPSPYPSNISDWFKGSWKLNSPRTNAVKKWPTHDSGSLSMIIRPSAHPSSDITLLKGEIELYDGRHVTERISRTGAQGIYFAATGALFLVVNPLTESIAFDYTLLLPQNVSYTAAELWESQVDTSKFPNNPFSGETQTKAPLNSSEVQATRELEKVIGFDSCTYVLVAQFATKEESMHRAPLRVWRHGRSIPFERIEDDGLTVGDVDENRLVYWMHGYMTSPRCGLMLEIQNDTRSGDYDALVGSGQLYSALSIVTVFLLLFLTIQHVETRKTNSAMLKISPWTLLCHISFDLIFSLFHLLLAFNNAPISRLVYFAFFLSFILYASFQVRYTLDVLQLGLPFNTAAGNLSRLYMFVYAYMGISVISVLLFEHLSWIPLLIANSCWLPQIIHNATQRTRNAFDWKFIIGTSAARLFAPAYLYASNQTLFVLPHRPGLIAFMVAYNAVQILLLIAQDKLGPRFFVPSWLLPAAYNYHRPIPPTVLQQALIDPNSNSMAHQDATRDNTAERGVPTQVQGAPVAIMVGPHCTICMSEINPYNAEHMIAPCNHVFHEPCLLRWMEQKMECPVCRGPLPFPPELDTDQDVSEAQRRPVTNVEDIV